MSSLSELELQQLAQDIKSWALEFGFSECRIVDPELEQYREGFQAWLDKGYHGEMEYLANHSDLRFSPASLHSGTQRVISLNMAAFVFAKPHGVLGLNFGTKPTHLNT